MYNQISKQLNEFLKKYGITSSHSDIFEEVTLKLAHINTRPKKCSFGPVNDTKIYFAIKGIREDDTPSVLAFFQLLGDGSAHYRFDNEYDAHYFEVEAQIVLEKLVPLFQDWIIQCVNQSPQTLTSYRLHSEESPEIKAVQILKSLSLFEHYIAEQIKIHESGLKHRIKSFFTSFRQVKPPSISSALMVLKQNIEEHHSQIYSFKTRQENLDSSYKIISAKTYFIMTCTFMTDDEHYKNLKNSLENYTESLHPKRCHDAPNLKIVIAEKASLLQGVAKKQLGLPDDIQALIVSFLADYKKRICQFGTKGRVIYLDEQLITEHKKKETYERNAFVFFKSITGSDTKKEQYTNKDFEEKNPENQHGTMIPPM